MSHDVDLYDQLEAAASRLASELGITPEYLDANRVDLAGDKGDSC